MRVPLLDLKAQFEQVEREVRAQIDDVLRTQNFILGPKVEELEQRLAERCQVAHAVGVSSGTDALLMALMALDIGPGDEIVTTPYSFFATIGGILRLGARPVFVDIVPETMNMDLAQVARALSKRTKAVICVHLFGRPVDVPSLRRITDPLGVPVIEDAAQALAAEVDGYPAGALGAMACFSFFPSKNLGGFGDGGAVTTNDRKLAERLRLLRGHGASPKYFHREVGGNFRLDALQAAVLLAKFPHLEAWTRRREENATLYARALSHHGLGAESSPIRLPPPAPAGHRQVFNQYVIRAQKRDSLAASLKDDGIQTEVYYPRPLHLQECLAGAGARPGDFPAAEAAATTALALPVAPEVSTEAVTYVADRIAAFYGVS
ncbi:MAG TPA: DegT/DnrJ/EryC1/StrS family aminotransferase [Polyangia bacterium]